MPPLDIDVTSISPMQIRIWERGAAYAHTPVVDLDVSLMPGGRPKRTSISTVESASIHQGRLMTEFLEGFIKGARETPRAYFAPAIALWRLLLSATDSLIGDRHVR